MAVYLISYDLNAPGQDYSRLISELTRTKAVRCLYSTWLIENQQTAVQVRDAIATYVDRNDRVLVVEITSQADWATLRLMPPAGEWLKARCA